MFVVGKVKDGLSDPVTREEIKSRTAAACGGLPEGPMRDTCNDWAAQYGAWQRSAGSRPRWGQRALAAELTSSAPSSVLAASYEYTKWALQTGSWLTTLRLPQKPRNPRLHTHPHARTLRGDAVPVCGQDRAL